MDWRKHKSRDSIHQPFVFLNRSTVSIKLLFIITPENEFQRFVARDLFTQFRFSFCYSARKFHCICKNSIGILTFLLDNKRKNVEDEEEVEVIAEPEVNKKAKTAEEDEDSDHQEGEVSQLKIRKRI